MSDFAARSSCLAVSRPDPLPFDPGEPERGEMWSPGGAPPAGLEFLGCRGTLMCWFVPCPTCCVGWVPVVPDGSEFGYRTAVEIGCSAGCDPPAVAWWHYWRLGILPPAPDPTEAQQRYARGAVRRALDDVFNGKDAIARARDAGRFAEAAGLEFEPLANAFAKAGAVPVTAVLPQLLAGAATPARLPNA